VLIFNYQLVEHSSLDKGEEDILTFFRMKLHVNFKGEVLTDKKTLAFTLAL